MFITNVLRDLEIHPNCHTLRNVKQPHDKAEDRKKVAILFINYPGDINRG